VTCRAARFRCNDGRTGFGVFDGTNRAPHDGDVFGAPRPAGAPLEHGAFALLSPCLPSRIIALWNNFYAMVAKLGKQAPAHVLWLTKPGASVIGPDEPIRRPRSHARRITFEGELGSVIGRRCGEVSADDAGAAKLHEARIEGIGSLSNALAPG